jgi:hypothetical protein
MTSKKIHSPKVSVIVVNWNVSQSLNRCLDSIFKTGYPNLEVFVIDNHSTDDSIKVARSFKDKGVTVVVNYGNLGFPKAVNQGLDRSTGNYILILNPDASLPENFFSGAISFFADHQDAWIMGPKLIDPDGKSQGSVFPEPSVVASIREFWLGQKGLTEKFTPQVDSPVMVNAISGACMFFPRETLQKTGKFTEEIFMYYEDLDYCRRIRNAGGEIYFNPQIRVAHEHGQSSIRSEGKTDNYIKSSSIWYNGRLKYSLLWFIIRTGQLFRSFRKS